MKHETPHQRIGLELRWHADELVTVTIAISYFNRQTLPVAISAIQHDIPISSRESGDGASKQWCRDEVSGWPLWRRRCTHT